jgi:hypothetical protein
MGSGLHPPTTFMVLGAVTYTLAGFKNVFE